VHFLDFLKDQPPKKVTSRGIKEELPVLPEKSIAEKAA